MGGSRGRIAGISGNGNNNVGTGRPLPKFILRGNIDNTNDCEHYTDTDDGGDYDGYELELGGGVREGN